MASTKFGITGTGRPNISLVATASEWETAVTPSLRVIAKRRRERNAGFLPIVVTSVPWSVVIIGKERVPESISRARSALIA